MCKYLSSENFINGIKLTEQEEKIFQFEVKEACRLEQDYNIGEYLVLNDEWKYLYDCESENYCIKQKRKLDKLTTNCNDFLVENE